MDVEKEQEEIVVFVALKERLIVQLQMVTKLQDLQLSMLEDVRKTSEHLANIQTRHPKWKVAQEHKELLKKAGVWTRLTYSSFTGVGLR